MIAYKVVSVKGATRQSLEYFFLPPEWVLTYTPGILITPLPGSKIFVFQDKELALFFAKEYYKFNHLEVWECECKNLTNTPHCVNLPFADPIAISVFWGITKHTQGHLSEIYCQNGTYLTDALTLTKCIESFEPGSESRGPDESKIADWY
jgi:hypothetical protein